MSALSAICWRGTEWPQFAALISPYREARDSVRRRIPNFIEVHLACPLDVLIQRDVKGLYKEALAGHIPHFTGISDPYEPPVDPDVTVDSARESPAESVEKICTCLVSLGLLEPVEAGPVGIGPFARRL